MEAIRDRGYIPSSRRGSTGIGHTFESEFGLAENNIAIPDIGGTVEIKTTRKTSSSLITLFTFNKGVWTVTQRNVLDRIGYWDAAGRRALKTTCFCGRPNNQNIRLDVDDERNVVSLSHDDLGNFAEWDLYVIVGKFYTKLSRLLLVMAESRMVGRIEEFHYNEAYMLSEPDVRGFRNAFRNSVMGIDLRMHLNPSGSVRNRGTAFRIREPDLVNLYESRQRLL